MTKKDKLKNAIGKLNSKAETRISDSNIESIVNRILVLSEDESELIVETLESVPAFRVLNESIDSTEANYWITVIGNILKAKE